MESENSGIYGKPNFKLIVVLFAVTLLICILAGWIYLRTGHPVMHTQPQPRNNKGSLEMQQQAAPQLAAALLPSFSLQRTSASTSRS